MLEIKIHARPDVNKILAMPVIQRRVKNFLDETLMQIEFSHTVLHRQHVFHQKPGNQLQAQAAAVKKAQEKKLED